MSKKVVGVQFNSWEKVYYFDPEDKDLKKDDYVVVETEIGTEIAKVSSFEEIDENQLEEAIKPIKRIAELKDLEIIQKNQPKNKEAAKVCKQLIRKYSLPMKLVDCSYSFDDSRVTFAFTSDTRVDFRDLVKDLTSHLQRKIRLQQIGIRDTLKQTGGIGPCGRNLCCNKFLDDLGNISTDMARDQQIEQRGSERLSGVCGRLKCCLAYETEGYKEKAKGFPAVGTQIKTAQGRGKVLSWNILKHSVDVRIDKDTVLEHYLGCKKVGCSGCKSDQYCCNK
ncbi:MAG: regulatory iron-sulfur-containing complex subunit RicT [Patescibacteria group bacterium]